MMWLELDDYDYKLIKKLEKENVSNYKILEVPIGQSTKYFIRVEALLSCLDDTQDNREYAELKIKELVDSIDRRED